MDRRKFLVGVTALAATQVACQQRAAETLRVEVLRGTLPPRLVGRFKQSLPDAAVLRLQNQKDLATLFRQLQQWQAPAAAASRRRWLRRGRSSMPADWVSLGDYWLTAAIQQQLIQPLAATALPAEADPSGRWRSLLQRTPEGQLSATGPLWASPYRWGQLVIVYARHPFEQLGWQPRQWSDLRRPDLAQRIALPNHPRLVLGLVLKSLGYSVNDPDPGSHADVQDALAALHPLPRHYTAKDYLQSLIQGDLWLAVGWSTDVQPVLQQYRQLQAVIPDPGTLLTADVWVKPRSAETATALAAPTKLEQAWLQYWWTAETVVPLSLFSQGLAPPLLAPEQLAQVTDLSADQVLLPTVAQLTQSEFLAPLPESALKRYTALWQQLRRVE